jgi:hypothetical protein
MSDATSRQQPADVSKRGEAAWREHRDAIASRNARASERGRARRQEEYERLLARQREADRRERAELAKRTR